MSLKKAVTVSQDSKNNYILRPTSKKELLHIEDISKSFSEYILLKVVDVERLTFREVQLI